MRAGQITDDFIHQIDHQRLAKETEEIRARQKPYAYTLNHLPQLKNELNSLKEREQTARNRARGLDSVIQGLTAKIADADAAREKLIDVKTRHVLPGASDKVAQLQRLIEEREEDLASARRERDRHQRIADATKKLIAEWPQAKVFKELCEQERLLNQVDGRLAAPSL